MSMDQRLIALFDELEKVGVNTALSHFQQSRAGRRPIRVDTLLEKEQTFDKKKEEEANQEDHKDYEVEGGLGMTEHPEG